MILGINAIFTILRMLFFGIDAVVYLLFSALYTLFLTISNRSFLSNETIASFASRIYVIIGIFMLFKLSVSLINMFVNPDTFSDEGKGFGKLIQRSILALAMLILVPFLFQGAYYAQNVIIKNNVIGNLILGKQAEVDTINEAGDIMAVKLFTCFFYSDDATKQEGLDSASKMTDLNVGMVMEQKGLLDDYAYGYVFIVSTIAGGFACYMLLLFVIDVSVRMIKLSFYQLLAPIPIIQYIDPSKGDDSLKKYLGCVGKTYAGLFLRIAILYFAMFLLIELCQNGFTTYELDGVTKVTLNADNWFGELFVRAAVIVGVLFFMKQAPKLIEEALGIKLDGDFSFNLKDKIGKGMLGAGLVAGGVTLGRSLANGDGFRKAWSQAQDNGKNFNFTPGSVRERKDKASAAKAELKTMHNNWKAGEKAVRTKLNDNADALNGANLTSYNNTFKHKDYASSKYELDKADNEEKAAEVAYEQARVSGNQAMMAEATERYRKAKKTKEGREKVYNTMRDKYQDDAQLDDQIKFYKNNATDPTRPSSGSNGGTSGGSNGGTSGGSNGGTSGGSNGGTSGGSNGANNSAQSSQSDFSWADYDGSFDT